MSIINFDVLLSMQSVAGEETPVARVLASPAGDMLKPSPLYDLDPNRILKTYKILQKRANVQRSDVKDLGETMYDALMIDEIQSKFQQSLGMARAQNNTLRLRLKFEDPTLAQIPWELLHSKVNFSDFLGTDADLSISRYLSVDNPVSSLKVELPLNILVVISAPPEQAPLNYEAERETFLASMETMLKTKGVNVDFEFSATQEVILSHMQTNKYHVLHLIGHGDFDGDKGLVILEKEKLDQTTGEPILDAETGKVVETEAPTDADTFAGMLASNSALRLVVLNACSTAQDGALTAFSGVASKLVERGAPAVIAMRNEIQDKVAIRFTKHLYGNLAGGATIDTAITRTRQQLYLEFGSNPFAFSNPILHLHTDDGHLFDITQTEQKQLVQITQQIIQLNETNETLSEWKELHDLIQRLSHPIELIHILATKPQGMLVIPNISQQFQRTLLWEVASFARKIDHIGKPYQPNRTPPIGEEWIVRTIKLGIDLEQAIQKENTTGVQETVGKIRSLLQKHRSFCNAQMLEILEQITEIYGNIRILIQKLEEANLAQPAWLNWLGIANDISALDNQKNRMSEWLKLHKLFDTLHRQYLLISTTASLIASTAMIAPTWEMIKLLLDGEFFQLARQLSFIGQALVEPPDGEPQGEPWAVDIKRVCDTMDKFITDGDMEQTRAAILKLGNLIDQHYLQTGRSIQEEILEFTKSGVALHARVSK